MKIAFVSLYEAWPPVSGAAAVTYHCAAMTPCDASLLVQVGGRANVVEQGHLKIVNLPLAGGSRKKKMLRMPGTLLRIRREIAAFQPDWVVIEGASWAAYLWALTVLLKLTLPRVKVAYHAHNVEYYLRQKRESKLATRITHWTEGGILRWSDRSFACSLPDQNQFVELYGVRPRLLPNGVVVKQERASDEAIRQVRERWGLTDETLLFMGLYAYPPNTEAVKFLMEHVMPELYKQRLNIRLVVTGGGPAVKEPWLILTGVVKRDELEALLSTCRIGVAPIFSGSGTRLKILEYIASRMPVVSTVKGAEGLEMEQEKHVWYAQTGAEFQQAILRIFENPQESEAMASRALTQLKERFEWTSVLEQFARDLNDPAK